jgi:hypothetical protein
MESCKCTNWYNLLSKNCPELRIKRKNYEPPIRNLLELLIQPLGRRKDEEEDKSEDCSTLGEDHSVKSNEVWSYEKIEELLLARLASILRDMKGES